MSRSVLSVAAAVLLTACSGSLFQSKMTPPTIYLLSAEPAGSQSNQSSGRAAPTTAEIPIDLAVLKPHLRTGLETDRIAVLYPDRRLDYFADARWSGPLREMLQDFVVQEFHSHAHLRTVSAEASVFASAYWLEIEVLDFQAEYRSNGSAPTVHVHLLARVGRFGDRAILGQFDADAQQPAAENRLTAIVDAYAHATDAAMTPLILQVSNALASASEIR